VLTPMNNCLSCGSDLTSARTHEECFESAYGSQAAIPLCDLCIDNPARMDLKACITNTLFSAWNTRETEPLLHALADNKTSRYLNLTGVVVCILIQEMTPDYVDIVLVHRKDQPEGANALSLVAGFMEQKHASIGGAVAAEIGEEANITIDSKGSIHPYCWLSNPRFTLTLNAVIIYPDAIIRDEGFSEDAEVSGRDVFRISRNKLPDLCFDVHSDILRRFHDEYFLANKPLYQQW